MIYEFMDDEGNIIEASYSMADAPAVGSVVTVERPDGEHVEATRIMSTPAVQGDNWRPYISSRLPRHLKGCRTTPSGKPIIETKQQEREVMARGGYERE